MMDIRTQAATTITTTITTTSITTTIIIDVGANPMRPFTHPHMP